MYERIKEQWHHEPILTTIAFICPVLLLSFLFWIANQHASHHRRALHNALRNEIRAHQPQIKKLLTEMNTSDSTAITLAIHEELQKRPSKSLISTSIVRVFRTNNLFHCEIDLGDFGLQPVIIRPITQ
jgi:hypothetical protein